MQSFKSDWLYPQMVEMRRIFHHHPELAFEEVQTAQLIIDELKRLHIPYQYDGKGSAVIGYLMRSEQHPTIALRAEMDALPGREATGLPFTSEVDGKVHACGHDAHMAMMLGAMELLCRDRPDGNVLIVFQPAEESGGGARTVLASGALKGVQAIYGGHVTHEYHTGEIMVSEGVITAQSDRFRLHVHGQGGHGARPHEAIDAVVIAAQLVMALQTIVSREINPVYPAVVTVGKVQAGSAANMIAGEAVLDGSIRSTVHEVRHRIHHAIQRMGQAMGELYAAKIDVEIHPGYPPVVNTRHETAIAQAAAVRVVGAQAVVQQEYPSLGSEDFSFYLQELPGCYVRFGARRAGQEFIPLHSPAFDIDETVLKVGADFFDQLVRTAFATERI